MTSRLFAGGGVQGEPGACGGGGGGAPLRPDLTTLGKYVGGGMPCGAFGGRADVMALFDPRHGGPGSLPHAGTFNNNVLTMNVGAAGLEAVFTPDAARALHRLGDDVRDRINALALASDTGTGTGTGGKRGVRVLGCGSLLVFHFTRTPLARIASPADWAADEDPRLLDLLHLEMLRAGFYLARRGYAALCLPLLAPEGRAALDRFVDAVGAFLVRFRELIEG
ncbi:putative glutamate-1-semialdehyde -aminomutase [Rosellinia necatrix]|uniref:Putative glutamate-1-semialdehyde-aminomutase n=1 Tax=Rosellinia necatrix TaxID=77044 RepID=A0A1W2TGM8_ROSNE|nr:putative glutamate-1-semialdehyde -aminomutase [Rosellinia necatrix]